MGEGHLTWYSSALFIEGNTFTLDNNIATNPNEQIYHQDGARTVIRYNTFDGTALTSCGSTCDYLFDSHGNQGGTDHFALRGQPLIEVYNNTFHVYQVMRFLNIRGGSIIAHDNTFIQDNASATPAAILLQEEEAQDSGIFCPSCPLITTWPAGDQINNSFFWNNTYNGSPVSNVSLWNTTANGKGYEDVVIQNGRNYFMHAPQSNGGSETLPSVTTYNKVTKDFIGHTMTFSSFGANAYYPYMEYTCPHPLTGLSGSCNTIAGTGGYNTQ